MRKPLIAALCLAAAATAAAAESPLSADAFDALTQGRTMTWAEYGQTYGVEYYLPGRRVRWTVLGEDCKTGHWYQDGPAICFVYEDKIDPVCWEITRTTTGLLARLTTAELGTEPVVIEETSEPMACFGPEVGA